MSRFLEVKCPDCKNVLIVNANDGKVVEVRKPILKDSSGDRFADAERKIREEKETIARKYEEAREKEKSKMDRLNALFDENLKRAREEGPTRPENPMDLD